MTSIEQTRQQKPKEYDPRKQDHGDAGMADGHERAGWLEERSRQLRLQHDSYAMREAIDEALTTYQIPELRIDDEITSEDDVETIPYSIIDDTQPTINEYDGRTDKEIRASMARSATLDSYEDDDFGDYSDSHVRINNRPR